MAIGSLQNKRILEIRRLWSPRNRGIPAEPLGPLDPMESIELPFHKSQKSLSQLWKLI
jgi:hypothetical protein